MDWDYRQSVVDNGKILRIQKEENCSYNEARKRLEKYRR